MIDQLSPGDCLVINDTRVLPARLYGHKTGTGSAPVEVLLLEQTEGDLWDCIVYPGRRLREGAEIVFGDGSLQAVVEQVKPDGNRLIRFRYQGIFLEILERLGTMPLPPYIKARLEDQERYQTVYSKTTALPPPPPPACTLRRSCWRPSGARAWTSSASPCMWGWAPSAR